MSLRSGELPFLGSEDEFFYHTSWELSCCLTLTRPANFVPGEIRENLVREELEDSPEQT
jgi:hypothetical protein